MRRLLVEHGMKALRYCGVSAVNMVVGVSVLVTCHALFGWSAVASNLAAWTVGTIPAYLLSRAWVWNRSGSHRLGGEVLPFWVMGLAGLGLSTVVVGLVEQYTHNTLYILTGNICAYGVVWVAKYVLLDQVIWHRRTAG